MARLKDYYQVLGVQSSAHARAIEESYWEQAHALHRETTHKAARRLSAINEAYETLSSPHKRAQYDRKRGVQAAMNAPPPRPGLIQVCMTLLSKPFRPD